MTFMILTLVTGCTSMEQSDPSTPQTQKPAYVLAIHGGAGVITKENISPEKEAAYREALDRALDIGEIILKEGGTSLEATVATITFMEDNPLFNAGKGAVFNHEGKNEMDASIMMGQDLQAGAVGGVQIIKNPILAARAVLEKSEHVLLTGQGAEKFAIEQGIETVDPSYFFTQTRWDALQAILKSDPDSTELDHSDRKHGTVGAVALDQHGNLTAATSTGGMTNKKYQRIGDSPIIGAGTYADNGTCAVSCTGHGEFFIRYAVAHAISAQMRYGHKTLKQAGDYMIHDVLAKAGGTGGLISVDKDGNVYQPFNTEGMYRGYVKPGEREIKIYKE
jgi:beta-aspartyl-peptidase (threonine type)